MSLLANYVTPRERWPCQDGVTNASGRRNRRVYQRRCTRCAQTGRRAKRTDPAPEIARPELGPASLAVPGKST